jgi:integrase
MRGKIGKRAVDALKVPERGQIVLWDNQLAGFGVRVRPGGAKTYLVRYRPGGGRRAALRTLTLGQHGNPLTPDQARREAERVLALVKQGKDPQAEKMKARASATMREFSAAVLGELRGKKKARTVDEYERLLEKLVNPAIGARKVVDVGRPDIARLHASLRETPYQANRVLAVLSKAFSIAERDGIRPTGSNPCRHVEKFKEVERERILSAMELAALGDAIAAYNGSLYAAGAIRLLLLTGARRSEILGLQWDWIDFVRGEARLPDSKTGTKTLHLPPPAINVLASLPRVDGNPYVIVGNRTGRPFVSVGRPWEAIRKLAAVRLWAASDQQAVAALIGGMADGLGRLPTIEECRAAARRAEIELPRGLDDLRLHDLRHAFASVAASSGMGLLIIGKILGHAQAKTTERYAHLESDPVKAAAAAVAGKIAGAMEGGTAGGRVIKLPKRNVRDGN